MVLRKEGRIYDNVGWYLENIGNLPAEEITITSKPKFYDKDNNLKIPEIKNEPIKIGIIMPKQKYDFAFDYFEVDDTISYVELNIEVNIGYKFLNKKKNSKFRYHQHNIAGYEEISCVESN